MGARDDEGESGEQVGNEREADDDLSTREQREEVSGRCESAHEVARGALRGRDRNEVKETVEAEDGEDEAEEETGAYRREGD